MSKNIQKDFFYKVNGSKKTNNQSIKVYKYLVFTSFHGLITNAFPLFYKEIKKRNLKKEFKKSIFAFMKKDAKSVFIWKMANEYRKFIKRNKSFFHTFKAANDIMHYESSELKVFMQKYDNKKIQQFSVKKKYQLSWDIVLKNYKHDILEKTYKEVDSLFVLVYFDKGYDDVVFQEINEAVYLFLKSINEKKNLNKNMKIFFKKNNLNLSEFKKPFLAALSELNSKKAIVAV